MLIYEKDNKLNINFDNEISEDSDLQISKEDGKTQVLIDGQPGGGGSIGSKTPVIVEFTPTGTGTGTWSGAAWEDLVAAFYDGQAFLSFGADFKRITGYRIEITEGTLTELIAEGVSQAGIYLYVSLRKSNNVVFKSYPLSS